MKYVVEGTVSYHFYVTVDALDGDGAIEEAESSVRSGVVDLGSVTDVDIYGAIAKD